MTNQSMNSVTDANKLKWLVLAGLIGGLAEVAWVGIYTQIYNLSFSSVGSAITQTVFGSVTAVSYPAASGLLIHMLLSVLLAVGFGYGVWPWSSVW